MKQSLLLLGLVGTLAATGCGGGGSSTFNPGVSSRVTAVQNGLATLRAGGAIGALSNLSNTAMLTPGATGNTQVPNPCDPTGAQTLYLVPGAGTNSLHTDAFLDSQHTAKAGSFDVTGGLANAGGATGAITFNNFGNCANGKTNFTLDGSGNNGTFQFVHLSLGSDLAVDGTLNVAGTRDATGKLNGTIATGAAPLTLTLAGQPFTSTVALNDTVDPTTHTSVVSGALTTRDPLGDTAATTYTPGGTSSTTVSTSSGTKIATESVAPSGAVTVTAFAPTGTALLTKTYATLLNVNANDFQ